MNKPKNGEKVLQVKIATGQHDKLKQISREAYRTMGGQIRYMIDTWDKKTLNKNKLEVREIG